MLRRYLTYDDIAYLNSTQRSDLDTMAMHADPNKVVVSGQGLNFGYINRPIECLIDTTKAGPGWFDSRTVKVITSVSQVLARPRFKPTTSAVQH